MTTTNLLKSIRGKLPTGYECLPTAHVGTVRVRTPHRYPDGGIVDVFVLRHDGNYRVTDYGDGLGWFRSQSIEERLSTEQRRRVKEFCQSLDVKLSRGCLSLACEEEGMADAVYRVARAVVQVSEQLAPARA